MTVKRCFELTQGETVFRPIRLTWERGPRLLTVPVFNPRFSEGRCGPNQELPRFNYMDGVAVEEVVHIFLAGDLQSGNYNLTRMFFSEI